MIPFLAPIQLARPLRFYVGVALVAVPMGAAYLYLLWTIYRASTWVFLGTLGSTVLAWTGVYLIFSSNRLQSVKEITQ